MTSRTESLWIKILSRMKRIVNKIIAFLAYWTGIDALFYRLNCKAKRIITFHNILSDEIFREGVANGVSNRLSEFNKIIDECEKRFKFSTNLFDAKTLTITFDDGYRNQYTTAFKILRKKGIPAYLFVSGDVGKVLTIDKLLHWVSEAPQEFIPGGDRLQYWIKDVWPQFMADAERRGVSVLESLDAVYSYEKIVAGMPEDYRRERLSEIKSEELDEMSKAGWKIGWHTKTHYPLSKIPVAELEDELKSPEEFRNVCFSYPYGNLVEVGESAIEKVRQLGYPCAVSNTTQEGEPYSKWFLPRFSLSSDKYQLHFDLSGFKHFMKHRRLLPKVS